MGKNSFSDTTGPARYLAALERYRRGEITPQLATEYLAELAVCDEVIDPKQRARCEHALLLSHDKQDRLHVDEQEFVNFLNSIMGIEKEA